METIILTTHQLVSDDKWDSEMRKEKLLERGDGDNSDDESGTEGVKQMDFLTVEFSRSREFWIKVKMQKNLNIMLNFQ